MNNVHEIVNNTVSMNTAEMSGADLEEALADKLRELLGQVEWLHETPVELMSGPVAGFDLLAALPLAGGGKAALCVECKSVLRPSQFLQMADQHFSPPGHPKAVVRVLALPWISPRIADLCAEHGWSWFDLAGNYRLDVPGLLHLQHTGNAPVHKSPRPTANLSTREAGRVVRALLTPVYAGHDWTQRSMQMHCRPDVSLGLVNKVVQYLREEAFIKSLPNGGFRLIDPLNLLFTWRDVYRFDQHQRHGYFTLLHGRQLKEALANLYAFTGASAAYAAFSAADFLAPHVRQQKTWLYIARPELDRFTEMVQAKTVDSGENIVVLVPSDDGVFFHTDKGSSDENRLPCTNPVQTYVDLWHCGGRGQEAAEAVLEQRLKPAWKAQGMKL